MTDTTNQIQPEQARPELDTLRVGVIGVGWAGNQHMAAYDAAPGVELAGIAGLEDAVRADLAQRYGVEHHVARWEELLELDGLDAVSVAVPTFLHARITNAALERGLHVLCEKPMAKSVEEAAGMVEAARTAGRVLHVAFNHRERGDIQKLKEVIDAGRLGRPYYAKAWWLRRSGIPTLGSWFTRSELAGGGPLLDIGVHVLDYSLFLLGHPAITAVSASTYDLLGTAGFGSDPESGKSGATDATTFDVEDLATVFMRLQDGGTLLVEASWAAHRSDQDEFGITIYGTDGGAELIVRDMEPSGSLRIFTDDGGVPAETRLTAPAGRGHKTVAERFVAAIRSGAWEGHDGAGAAELARVVDACYRSAADRREIRLAG
ncbi:MAG TPA: Gfo/Idh/MocA family oxidoreductase [Solirubrobacteraceae bacterium]|nr:Gfo/Idh/MocA family oxidoreductase [Solirubrobacteraceae bacterium]